jgi:hypothetical protein
MEHHLLTDDVIAKAPPAQAQPVLSFALGNAFEFDDLVAAATVIGVRIKNCERFRVVIHQLWMASDQPAE